MPLVSTIGIDYAGTLTQRSPDGTHQRRRVEGAHVARMLLRYGLAVPERFAAGFDAFRSYWTTERSSLACVLTDFLAMVGIDGDGIDTTQVADAVIAEVGDHPIDADAADAVRTLHSWGLTCVLTSNTSRTHQQRGTALAQAGLGFLPLWLSCEVGHAKPDGRFYEQLFTHMGITPQEFVGVGDQPRTDIAGARMAGSAAVLVDTWPSHQQRAADARNLGALVIPTLADLPCHLWPQGPSPSGRWELCPQPIPPLRPPRP